MVQELIDTREQKRESGNVVYLPRMLGGKRAVDHCTDALRALMFAMVAAVKGGDVADDGSEFIGEADWSANPFAVEQKRVTPMPEIQMTSRL